MKSFALVAVLAAGTLVAQTSPPSTTLKVGDTAPDFTLPDNNNKPVKLSDFRGKKTVVLAFFPAAFTGGWTKEITAYQSGIAKFEDHDAQVLAISTDFTPTLNHWAKELNATFPLLSDHMRKVSEQYGVLNAAMGIANRVTFVLDPEGKITDIFASAAALDPTGAETACRRLKKKTD